MKINASKLRAASIVIGLLFSSYALTHQIRLYALGETNAVCNINDYFSCDKAAVSPYAILAGAPQGLWGVIFFLSVAWLTFRKPSPGRQNAILLIYLIGVAYVLRLFLLSVFVLHTVCLTCVAVHLTVYCGAYLSWRQLKKDRIRVTPSNTLYPLILPGLLLVSILPTYSHYQSPFFAFLRAQRLAHGPQSKQDAGAEEFIVPVLPHNQILGNPNGSIKIIEFIDYTCPYCSSFKRLTDILLTEHSTDVKLVLKHFPLSMKCNYGIANDPHPDSCAVAKIAHCYAKLGHFKEFYEKIFVLYDYTLSKVIKNIGVEMSETDLATCIAAKSTMAEINEDISLGIRYGAKATPFVVVNGHVVTTLDLPSILKFKRAAGN